MGWDESGAGKGCRRGLPTGLARCRDHGGLASNSAPFFCGEEIVRCHFVSCIHSLRRVIVFCASCNACNVSLCTRLNCVLLRVCESMTCGMPSPRSLKHMKLGAPQGFESYAGSLPRGWVPTRDLNRMQDPPKGCWLLVEKASTHSYPHLVHIISYFALGY